MPHPPDVLRQCWLRSRLTSLLAIELATDSVSLSAKTVVVAVQPAIVLSQYSLRSLLVSLSMLELATDSVSLWICTSAGGWHCLALTCLCHSLFVHSLVQHARLLLLQLVWQLVHL